MSTVLACTDAPSSLRYLAMLEGGPEHRAIWKYVPAMVREGRQNAFMRWNESECSRILQTIRRHAKPGSRIFIVEHIVPGPSESRFSKLVDIHMMCWGSGRERTEEEYVWLLENSGWRFVGCHYPSHA